QGFADHRVKAEQVQSADVDDLLTPLSANPFRYHPDLRTSAAHYNANGYAPYTGSNTGHPGLSSFQLGPQHRMSVGSVQHRQLVVNPSCPSYGDEGITPWTPYLSVESATEVSAPEANYEPARSWTTASQACSQSRAHASTIFMGDTDSSLRQPTSNSAFLDNPLSTRSASIAPANFSSYPLMEPHHGLFIAQATQTDGSRVLPQPQFYRTQRHSLPNASLAANSAVSGFSGNQGLFAGTNQSMPSINKGFGDQRSYSEVSTTANSICDSFNGSMPKVTSSFPSDTSSPFMVANPSSEEISSQSTGPEYSAVDVESPAPTQNSVTATPEDTTPTAQYSYGSCHKRGSMNAPSGTTEGTLSSGGKYTPLYGHSSQHITRIESCARGANEGQSTLGQPARVGNVQN
ncbi:MAG: hypothetical protein M1814_000776, partial [Vezdaea aestivalis]